MKLVLNVSLLFFILFISEHKTFSLSDYQIKKICKNQKRESTCKKNLQKKKSNLEKGVPIEIPVVPYKR